MGGAEYDYGSPMGGWSWSGQQRRGRQPSQEQTSGYGDAWRAGGDDARSERSGTGSRSGSSRGSFAGRGPRGYQRSDERIREEICERMCDNAELDASAIEIVVLSGEVTLQGNVNDRYDKRLAEDLTQDVSGVREVNNQLRVAPGMGQEGQQQPPLQNRPGDPPRYRVA
jgi:osmotically-inducible protein OsmY